jgi:hypothetical protein
MAAIKRRLETLVSAATFLGALAYLLGWLKLFFFYQTFGVGLDLAQVPVQEYVLESWFVIENVVFLLLLWWVVLKVRSRALFVLGVVYSILPIASHYAFAASPQWNWVAEPLIHYRHTVLKFIPLVTLPVVYALSNASKRAALRELTWPYTQGSLVIGCILAAAWAISTAKHFGSFDANQVVRCPDDFLPKVELRTSGDAIPSRPLHLLRTTPDSYILVDLSTGPVFSAGCAPTTATELTRSDVQSVPKVGLVIVPKTSVRWIDGTMNFQIQRGWMIL